MYVETRFKSLIKVGFTLLNTSQFIEDLLKIK